MSAMYAVTVTAGGVKIVPERGVSRPLVWVDGLTVPQGLLVSHEGAVYMAEESTATTPSPDNAAYRSLLSNLPRSQVTLYNSGNGDVWLSFGGPAETGKGTLLAAGDQLFIKDYQGPIFGVGSSTVTGNDIPGGAR